MFITDLCVIFQVTIIHQNRKNYHRRRTFFEIDGIARSSITLEKKSKTYLLAFQIITNFVRGKPYPLTSRYQTQPVDKNQITQLAF